MKELNENVSAQDQLYRDFNNKVWMIRGAKDAFANVINHARSKGIDPPAEWPLEVANFEKQIKELEEKRQEHLCKAYLYRGAIDDMNWWSEWIYTDWAGEGREQIKENATNVSG